MIPVLIGLSLFCTCLGVVTIITVLDLQKERRITRRLFRERLAIHDKNMTLAGEKVKLTGEVQNLSRLLSGE